MTAVLYDRLPAAVGRAPPGEFRRGWKILVPSVAGCAFTMGTIATISIGPFVKPLGDAMGWSRTAVQTSLLFGQGFSSFGVLVMGVLLERIGLRWAAIAGLAGTALALVLMSLSRSLIFFDLAFGLGALIGSASGTITWSRAVTSEFDKHRGLALGVILSGTGLSMIFLPSILVWVLDGYGWRAAYIALACFPGLIALPTALWLFKPREAISRKPARSSWNGSPVRGASKLKDIVGCYRFWILLLSLTCAYAAITAVLPNFISALTDNGVSFKRAAAAQGVFGAAVILARFVVGVLVDRFWAPAVGAAFCVPPAVGCLLLASHPDFVSGIIAAGLIGMAMGAEFDLLALLISRYFRPAYFSRTYSYIYASIACAGAVSPMWFAHMQEVTGTYDRGFYIAAALFVISGAVLPTLGRYHKFADDEEVGT